VSAVLHKAAVGCMALILIVLCNTAKAQPVRANVVASGLEHPWGLAILPDGQFLVTERPGRMRLIDTDGRLAQPLNGLPAVAASGQGGLLDVIVDRDFARNRTLFFCFSEPGPGGNSTALASARLSSDKKSLESVNVIFSQKPKIASTAHFGCRIVQGQADDLLFMTLGERYVRKDDAQTLDNHHGKIIRIHKDGRIPTAPRLCPAACCSPAAACAAPGRRSSRAALPASSGIPAARIVLAFALGHQRQ
jgi:glucose/arabinose dehydrogenase